MNKKIVRSFTKSARGDWIRLLTLTYLRWLAVFGQLLALLVGHYILFLDFNLMACLGLILLSSVLNIISTIYFPKTKRLSEHQNMLLLLYDLLQLGCMLFFTGGLTNPFSVLILAPVIISATVLNLRFTILLGISAVALITILSGFYIPLRNQYGEVLEPPYLLLIGNWLALSIAILFIAVYSRRVATETFSMSKALQAMQMALEREYRLTSLGGIVAAAAHELGTPLATIKLASTELQHGFSNMKELNQDLNLISMQVDRCKEILNNIGRRGKEDIFLRNMPIMIVLQEAVEPYLAENNRVLFSLNGNTGQDLENFNKDCQPLINRKPELIYGLRNIIQNAIHFSTSTVFLDVKYNSKTIIFQISDDGDGFPAHLLDRIGEPFLIEGIEEEYFDISRPHYEGMGLGLFIAKTLLEHLGGIVSFKNKGGNSNNDSGSKEIVLNKESSGTGAVVTIQFDKSDLEEKT
ncbi:MAG: ActS/PrrB/RegB family redox-sensitive histidine kinase [Paracoccaceae bacterium]|nr:ActS/PrrB/RegB family redox-sensitive histidine kinase [Paracoccaceae bacterium]